MAKTRVGVIMGGPSMEHDISLKTGQNVLLNLDGKKYEAVPVVVSREGDWEVHPEDLKHQIDLAFIAMHGDYGEDGTVQHELELASIPYTGSNIHSSALAMNKFLSLRILQDHGLNVPQMEHVGRVDWAHNPDLVLNKINSHFEYPLVLKPNRGGSSLDTLILTNNFKLGGAIEKLLEKYPDIIIQPFVRGREVTCAALDHGHPGSTYPLVPTEIIPRKSHFFDYDSKYQEHGAEEVTPARMPEIILKEFRKAAEMAHDVLGCRIMSRTDFILDKKGKIHLLEVNTIPGLTKTSLLPKGAEAMGVDFPRLLDNIIRSSLNKT